MTVRTWVMSLAAIVLLTGAWMAGVAGAPAVGTQRTRVVNPDRDGGSDRARQAVS